MLFVTLNDHILGMWFFFVWKLLGVMSVTKSTEFATSLPNGIDAALQKYRDECDKILLGPNLLVQHFVNVQPNSNKDITDNSI